MNRSIWSCARVAGILFVVLLPSCARREPQLLDEIAREISSSRTVEGRLADVNEHRLYRAEARSPLTTPTGRELVAAVQEIQETARRQPGGETLRKAASIELLLGNSVKAIALLTEALDREPENGLAWNDLAVAYMHESGRMSSANIGRVAALEAALAATEYAPTRPEVWFNLGLAGAWLSLQTESELAWQRVIKLEPSEAWRAEVRSRQSHAGGGPDRWQSLRASLSNPTVDPSKLRALALEFPQQAEEFLIDTLIPDWSRAFIDKQSADAKRLADQARLLAGAIGSIAGDRYLAECVTTLTSKFARGPQDLGATALARAHIALAEGRRFFEHDQWDSASDRFAASRKSFAGTGSPCQSWVVIQDGIRAFQTGRSGDALRIAQEVARRADMHGHLSLRARAEWLKATGMAGLGRFDQSVLYYERAAELYELTRQLENRLVVRGAEADAYRLLGETESGWPVLLPSVHAMRDIARTRRRYQLFLNGSLYATSHRLHRAALAFHRASLDMANERKVVNTIVEALIRGARIELQMRRPERAAAELRRAEQLLPNIDTATVRRYQSAWLAREWGEINAQASRANALSQLDGIIDFFSTREPAEVPQILLTRGRAARALDRLEEAEQSFLRGIQAFEGLWSRLSTDQHQISYLSESWDLFDEMVELRASGNDLAAAFRYSEIARSYSLDPSRRTNGHTELTQVQLDGDTVVLYFASLRDRLLIWRADKEGIRHTSSAWERSALASRTNAFRRLVEAGATTQEVQSLGRELYNALITPAGRIPGNGTLVLLPDADLPGLPFAALVNPQTGRFLIEEQHLVAAPSVKFLVDASRRLAEQSRGGQSHRIVAVGGEASSMLGLPRLPGALQELNEVRRAYGTSPSSEDRVVTARQFEKLVRGADVVHFAGHARANVTFPWRSSLLFVPDDQHQDGMLLASEIGTWRLPETRLVVLSACQTAFGGMTRNPGMLGMARPFLLAGVPSVVGSLWDVDDGHTLRLMSQFHRHFASGASAARSLRQAQLHLLRGSDAGASLPRNWSGFLLVGGIPQH